MTIAFTPASTLKAKPTPAELGFGTHATDHFFLVEYREGTGWLSPRIEPYGSLALDPRALAFHYGCSIFEGLKIFRQPDGGLAIFRPEANAARLNASAELVALPRLPSELFIEGLVALVRADAAWAPQDEACTLYARPVMLGVQSVLGVQRSLECLFYILLTPTPAYYRKGQPGFRLLADPTLARGGAYTVAAAKTAGNYSMMVVPMEKARAKGYNNILWIGGPSQRHIEEAGITNVFVVYEDRIVTPPLNGRILAGVTRDSAITVLRDEGLRVDEAETDIGDLCAGIASGAVREVFLTGTATVVAPVASISFEDREYTLPVQTMTASALYETLTGIQYGHRLDPYGWLHHV
jgi:branched-chain amino acid aminotransferase